MKIAIVGAGIAGISLVHFLKQFGCKDITLYDFNEKSLKTSYNSTAVLSSFGVRKGISEFGDLLSDSFDFTYNWIESLNLSGVNPTVHEYFCLKEKNEESFDLRFSHLKDFKEHAFLIDSDIFLDALIKKNNISIQSKFISNLNALSSFDSIILCAGALGKLYNLYPKSPGKVKTGSYLLWKNIDYPESFHKDYYKDFYLSYRRSSKRLLLGSTTESMNFIGARDELLKAYKTAKNIASCTLPSLVDSQVKIGQRHLGEKRKPAIIEHGHNIFSIQGLYKNGWSLGPYLAYKLARKIMD